MRTKHILQVTDFFGKLVFIVWSMTTKRTPRCAQIFIYPAPGELGKAQVEQRRAELIKQIEAW